MEGTTNREGTLRSPYAALYIWKAANSASHSSLSDLGDLTFVFDLVDDFFLLVANIAVEEEEAAPALPLFDIKAVAVVVGL